jgi:glycolate oxidase iron-sulfur subunit
MQTRFSESQLAEPDNASSEQILRACVHCGFCTATCPTYVLLGDELDSPRGRIYLIKDMLENDRPASAQVVKHVDRCLTCLSCMTTCPSGVNYLHLVDHARHHIEKTYRRPFLQRVTRRALGFLLPRPALFRGAMALAVLARPVRAVLPARLRGVFGLVPRRLASPSSVDRPQVFAAEGVRRMRVALMTGCAQQVLSPRINEATIRLLTRHGVEVVVASGAGCCGALTHHLGQDGLGFARRNIEAWSREAASAGGLDAIVINASGCGTTVKDYGFMFRSDPEMAEKAARIAALTKDISEVMHEIGLLPRVVRTGQRVAYHSACSLQHGQRVRAAPVALLAEAGFDVVAVPEGHLCCGSAGTYNILQPELAGELRARKVRNIESTGAEIVAAGNIGCITHIGADIGIPVVHTVELLDWATGGPLPDGVTASV